MKIPIYQVDAFAGSRFKGNPAAVCLLESWLDDSLLQSIATENNLSETAFVKQDSSGQYELRWFTPSFEIPLCGHATLAASYVIFQNLDGEQGVIHFSTKSGELHVSRENGRLVMDFPAYEVESIDASHAMIAGLGGTPREMFKSGINYYAVFGSEHEVRSLKPDFAAILDLIRGNHFIGIVPTARGQEYDFVSRYFAPEEGTNIGEDPVTGSIHSVLIPFWSERLGKTKMHAYQASERGGELFCELIERDGSKRSLIGGFVQPYLEGFIEV
ncbi:MAG: PhzF family phenazine biosynthesis protein [Rhodothermales bacterium]